MPEILTVDGVSLRRQGVHATTRTGRYSVPALRGENTILPGASGTLFSKNRPFEEGSGVISLFVTGAGTDGAGNMILPATHAARRVQFEANMAGLMQLFTRPHRLSTIRAEQADGTIRTAQVEWREWSEPDVQAGGTRAEFSIGYTIPGVWWTDEAVTTQSTLTTATLPANVSLTSFANMTGVIEDPILRLTGPITSPRITDVETGVWVSYTGTVPAGQVWEVDVAAATSKVSGSAAALNSTLHGGSYKMFTISNCYGATTTPLLRVSGSGASAATKLDVVAKRKWATG